MNELEKNYSLITEYKSSKLIFVNKFGIWFTVFAGIVSLFNALGYDDKGLLLYLTSPPFWILDQHNSLSFFQIVNVISWLLFGVFIDWRLRKSAEVSFLKKVGSVNPILLLFIIISFLISLLGASDVVYVLIHG